jgi:hypothetical protein
MHETIKWYRQFHEGIDTLTTSASQLLSYEMSDND